MKSRNEGALALVIQTPPPLKGYWFHWLKSNIEPTVNLGTLGPPPKTGVSMDFPYHLPSNSTKWHLFGGGPRLVRASAPSLWDFI